MKNDSNWLEYMSHAAYHAADDICRYFRLAPWQFNIVETDDHTQFVIMLIPDIRDNISQMQRVMGFYGYVLGRRYDLPDNDIWKQLEFHPHFQLKNNGNVEFIETIDFSKPVKI